VLLAEGEALGPALSVGNLQGGDPVAVLLTELFPGLDGVASTVGGVGGVAGLDDLVGGGVVVDLFVHLAHVDDPLPKLGGRQRCDGLIEGAASGGSDLLDGRLFGRACPACGCELCVGVERDGDPTGDVLQCRVAGELGQLGPLPGSETAVQT
jgi:hypothetical protein